MGRGIERAKIFPGDEDRTDCVNRVAALCRDRQWAVYAWALLPNHFHLLVRTGERPLAQSMRKLLTGYVVNFNRRHKRYGHLFQKQDARPPRRDVLILPPAVGGSGESVCASRPACPGADGGTGSTRTIWGVPGSAP